MAEGKNPAKEDDTAMQVDEPDIKEEAAESKATGMSVDAPGEETSGVKVDKGKDKENPDEEGIVHSEEKGGSEGEAEVEEEVEEEPEIDENTPNGVLKPTGFKSANEKAVRVMKAAPREVSVTLILIIHVFILLIDGLSDRLSASRGLET